MHELQIDIKNIKNRKKRGGGGVVSQRETTSIKISLHRWGSYMPFLGIYTLNCIRQSPLGSHQVMAVLTLLSPVTIR